MLLPRPLANFWDAFGISLRRSCLGPAVRQHGSLSGPKLPVRNRLAAPKLFPEWDAYHSLLWIGNCD
ncbi:MAG: hypothetical protein ACAI34_19200 [Verrucomicrobium sp.]